MDLIVDVRVCSEARAVVGRVDGMHVKFFPERSPFELSVGTLHRFVQVFDIAALIFSCRLIFGSNTATPLADFTVLRDATGKIKTG
jgi:hypothetical protein